MTTRTRRNLKLTEETNHYIEEIMNKEGIMKPADAIDRICSEHKQFKEREWDVEYFSKIFGQTINDLFAGELKKILMAANHADKTSQINLELLNTMFTIQRELKDLDVCYVTDKEDGLWEAIPTRQAKEAVEDRISTKRQKRIDAQKGAD